MDTVTQILTTTPGGSLHGAITVPGDKSISHRALLFGALAEGETTIAHFLASDDTRATADCLRAMGVRIEDGPIVRVHGVGLHGLRAPEGTLWAGNSGTTTRLLMGVLAGQPFTATLAGDPSLSKRPMDRVAIPLRQMGAAIDGQGPRCTPPVTVRGGHLHSITYQTPVASAQVKSAILLAGLFTDDGYTSVTEPKQSRDHTERMLRGFGVRLLQDKLTTRVHGGQTLRGMDITVPGDISSAAFFLVAGAITPGAEVTVRGVCVNPTRSGIIDVLDAMGTDMLISYTHIANGEPVADITIGHSALHGTEIGGDLIPRLIDELPVLAVAAAFAEGNTIIRDAGELRVKESDRIATVTSLLRVMGAEVEERPDGMIIHGGRPLHGAEIDCAHDHRIAMSAAVAGIAANVPVTVQGAETIATSFPNFMALMQELGAGVEMAEAGLA